MSFTKVLARDIFKMGKSELFSVCHLISQNVNTTSRTYDDIETVDLAYTVYDESSKTTTKPPLVIFHGFIGSRRGWDGMSKLINQTTGRRVITVDARNHGDSPHSPQHTFIHMAHDVIELLKGLELSKVSLLGHSMGAGTAMALALICPNLISSLSVEDLSPITRSRQALIILKLLEAMVTLRISSDVPLSKAKELAHEHLKAVTADVNIRNYLIDSLVNTNTGLYSWKCNAPILKEVFLTNILYYQHKFKDVQYTGPTLFIGGSLSDFMRKSDLPEIQNYFPSAELIFVDGAGHWVHSQKPKEFLEILCKFLIEK